VPERHALIGQMRARARMRLSPCDAAIANAISSIVIQSHPAIRSSSMILPDSAAGRPANEDVGAEQDDLYGRLIRSADGRRDEDPLGTRHSSSDPCADRTGPRQRRVELEVRSSLVVSRAGGGRSDDRIQRTPDPLIGSLGHTAAPNCACGRV